MRQVKRIVHDVDQGLVKFKPHLKSELEDHPRRKSKAETEPRGEDPAKASRTKRSGEPVKEELRACKPETPAETRGVKEVSLSESEESEEEVSEPPVPLSSPAGQVIPKAPEGPPPPKPVKTSAKEGRLTRSSSEWPARKSRRSFARRIGTRQGNNIFEKMGFHSLSRTTLSLGFVVMTRITPCVSVGSL